MLSTKNHIGTFPCPDCPICGTAGSPLYCGLHDQLFNAPGDWNIKRCPRLECGLLWLDPMPNEEDISKAYQRYYTHHGTEPSQFSSFQRLFERASLAYARAVYGYPISDLSLVDRALGKLLRFLPLYCASVDSKLDHLPHVSNGRLLEIGCGQGRNLRFFELLGWRVEGIDPDRAAIQHACQRGFSVQSGTIFDFDFGENAFDAVVMVHSLEHVHDPIKMLRECFRILKPGGQFLAITPNASSWAHRIYGPAWRGLEPPRHLHIFTVNSLQRITNLAGFPMPAVSSRVSGANSIFVASQSIRNGSPITDLAAATTLARLRGRAMQFFECLMLIIQPDCGEELVVGARKGP